MFTRVLRDASVPEGLGRTCTLLLWGPGESGGNAVEDRLLKLAADKASSGISNLRHVITSRVKSSRSCARFGVRRSRGGVQGKGCASGFAGAQSCGARAAPAQSAQPHARAQTHHVQPAARPSFVVSALRIAIRPRACASSLRAQGAPPLLLRFRRRRLSRRTVAQPQTHKARSSRTSFSRPSLRQTLVCCHCRRRSCRISLPCAMHPLPPQGEGTRWHSSYETHRARSLSRGPRCQPCLPQCRPPAKHAPPPRPDTLSLWVWLASSKPGGKKRVCGRGRRAAARPGPAVHGKRSYTRVL